MVPPGKRPFEAVLNEIVGSVLVAAQQRSQTLVVPDARFRSCVVEPAEITPQDNRHRRPGPWPALSYRCRCRLQSR